MRKMLSVLLIGIFLFGSVYLILKIPTASKLIACYDEKTQSFDEAEYGSRAQGWSELRLCQMKQQTIFDLSECITETGSVDQLPGNVYSMIIPILPIVHPGITEINMLKREHDVQCAAYPSTMFEVN